MLTSPVSRWTLPARAYLAVILILILVLVAAHFAIQVWGQTQAEQWVSSWEKQYGGHVGKVRLRMLRGVLTLSDVAWVSGDVSLKTPYIMLRGNLTGSSSEIEIREIKVKGGLFTLPEDMMYQSPSDKRLSPWLPWQALLKYTRKISGRVDIAVKGGHYLTEMSAWKVKDVSFHLEPMRQLWTASGKLFAGHIDIHHQLHTTDMAWKNLKAKAFFKGFGLAALNGRVDGSSTYNGAGWSGKIRWKPVKDNLSLGKLAWHSIYHEHLWTTDIHTSHWPLQIFQSYMPSFYGHQISQAYLNGTVHVLNELENLHVNIAEGTLERVKSQWEGQSAWQFEKVYFSQAALLWPQRKLKLESARIKHGVWGVANPVLAATNNSAWKLKVPNIEFSHIKFGDIESDFWIPEMQGKASLKKGVLLVKSTSNTDVMGKWVLQGSVNMKHKAPVFDMNIQAEHIPLTAFRDKLPVRLSENTGLDGQVGLRLHALRDDGEWHLKGDVDVHDMHWDKNAWLWTAKNMSLKNISFGSTEPVRIAYWQVNDWFGQAPLQPWIGIENNTVNDKNGFWLQDWQVDKWVGKHGRFALGQADDVWLEVDEAKLSGIEKGKHIGMNIKGSLADGQFSLTGKWFPWGDVPWVSLKASVKHALPFVAGQWLQLSGLPMFTQGRLSASLNINKTKQEESGYDGLMRLSLNHAKLEQGVFSNTMFFELTGYAPDALFERVAPDGDMRLSLPFKGNWKNTPLSWHQLGKVLLTGLKKKAATQVSRHQKTIAVHLSNIRLHSLQEGLNDGLQHNERVRLRKVLSVLRRERTWKIELIPQLGEAVLDDALQARIRYTQQQIEHFLSLRGVSPSRIFPVWPEEANREGTSTGILIQAVK